MVISDDRYRIPVAPPVVVPPGRDRDSGLAGSRADHRTAIVQRVGCRADLPVWIGPPDAAVAADGKAVTTAYTTGTVRVAMASHAMASALGVHGVVFSMAPAGSAGGRVHVSVDYSSFAAAYGGGYASRLRVVELPGCALTTPQVASCRVQSAVMGGSADDVRTGRVGADVTCGIRPRRH